MFNLFKKKKPQARRYTSSRNFSAAKLDRLTESWTSTPQSIDSILQANLRTLVARSREQSRNNDYARKFIIMVKGNVIGPDGVTFQARALNNSKKPDTLLNEAIEAAWKSFRKKGGCDVTGAMSLIDAANTYISTIAIDGEAIVVHVPNYGNAARYAVQFIDPQALDVTYNRELKNGNKIRMGIELNSYRKPVAYHFTVDDTRDQDYTFESRRYKRVPASQVMHSFISEFLNQSRGYPWMSTALLRMNMLNGYEDAAITAARVGAAKMGVYTTPNGDYTGDGVDADGNTLVDAEAGSFERLPEGSELMSWNPQYPHEQFGTFVKACLRGIGAGLGVSYNGLANDLEGVNFSSIRAGVLDERETWKGLQRWTIENFYEPIYEAWLGIQIIAGNIKVKGHPISIDRFDKCCSVSWQGRRWAWVDPLKDMNANKVGIDNGITTVSAVIRESGRDPEEVWQERKREMERMKELGIDKQPEESGINKQPEESGLTSGDDDDDEKDQE